jgi:hypothetical protein
MKKNPSMLTQVEILQLLKSKIKQEGQHFIKVGVIEARLALEGEKITTTTKQGVETKNTALNGDYVVKNPMGEEYIVPFEKFQKKYQLMFNQQASSGEQYSVYQAVGECFGIEVTPDILRLLGYDPETTQVFEFEPPWGGKMICYLGDMLVSPTRSINEIYRIGKPEFEETYRLAE